MRCISHWTLRVVFTINNNVLVFSIPVSKEKHTYLINKGNSDVDYFLVGVMVIVLASSVIDSGFDPRSDQNNYDETSTWCFSAKRVQNVITCLTCRPRAMNINIGSVGLLENGYQYHLVKSSFSP